MQNGDRKGKEDMLMTNSISKKLELFATQTGHTLQNLKEYRFLTKGKTSCFSKSVVCFKTIKISQVYVIFSILFRCL